MILETSTKKESGYTSSSR